MQPRFKIAAISLSVASALVISKPLLAQEITEEKDIETIKIIGSQSDAKEVAGSAHVVTDADLQEVEYTDATRALQQVPGVYIQQEDGLGLRPNIGLRGSGTERSGRITLMEDGVLIAPAPYAAAAAYYFPTFDRMEGIEVLKGAASIQYGPFTTGGAINFISRQIPLQAEGRLNLAFGENGQRHGYFFYGDSMENFGYLIEANKHIYDGFKTIDRSDNNTGFDKNDYLVKLRFNTDTDVEYFQQFDLKIQHSTEDSEQSYLGLTEVDYAANPYRMYGASQLDNFQGEHDQYMASYLVEFSSNFDMTITGYRNETFRNWFKTEALSTQNGRVSWANAINAINEDPTTTGAMYFQSVLNGGDTVAGDQIEIRSNKREYLSQGVQADFNWSFVLGDLDHNLEFGVRYHEDEEDRLQRNSYYVQSGGALRLDDLGVIGNAGNRLQTARALSYYITDTIKLGDWTFTPGLRYEDIKLARIRWQDQPLRTTDQFRDERSNEVSELLPGIGALYTLNDTTALLFGINKGFAPPGNDTGDQPEESWNYEFGVRFAGKQFNSELIAFVSDYDNLLGECTNANSGCDSNNDGDKENGGKAFVQGIELVITGELAENWPARLTYTYTDTEFKSSFNSDVWGVVENGNSIPYIPESIAQLSLGYADESWSVFTRINYVDGVCTKAACGQFQKTDDLLVVDLSVEHHISKEVSLYAQVDNVFEEDGIAAREPYGARPTKDRSIKFGLKLDL